MPSTINEALMNIVGNTRENTRNYHLVFIFYSRKKLKDDKHCIYNIICKYITLLFFYTTFRCLDIILKSIF